VTSLSLLFFFFFFFFFLPTPLKDVDVRSAPLASSYISFRGVIRRPASAGFTTCKVLPSGYYYGGSSAVVIVGG
jgi:hypothetical protein